MIRLVPLVGDGDFGSVFIFAAAPAGAGLVPA